MDHVAINRAYWDGMAHEWVESGEGAWALETPNWGIWQNSEVELLPRDMGGLAAIELGCGTGYIAAWMARRGATVTGIDISAKQLSTARRLAAEHDLNIAFIEGNAEATGLANDSFDFAISEYGAAIWCPADAWLSEAHRILRPGGRLVFLGNHPLASVASPLNGAPCDFTLHRSYRDLGLLDWTTVEIDPGGIGFNLSIAGWMRQFAETGFAVEGYDELYAPDGVEETRFYVPPDWARQYPSEQVWHLRKL